MSTRHRARATPSPLCELVRFEATDHVRLAGVLDTPRRRTRRAIVWLHGTRGAEIVPKTLSRMMLSWRAFYDMANPRGDYNVFPFSGIGRFRHIRGIRKPALYIYGERDEYIDDVPAAMSLLSKNLGPKGEIVVMSDARSGERRVGEE